MHSVHVRTYMDGEGVKVASDSESSETLQGREVSSSSYTLVLDKFRGVAIRKTRRFLKAMIMSTWCTKIVVSWTLRGYYV